MRDNEKPDQSAVPWYESNLFWGPLALAGGILLTVVAAMKHDLTWLLWFAWVCFGVVIWWLARRTREVLLISVLGVVVAGAGLLWLSNWLRLKATAEVSTADTVSSGASPINRAPPHSPATSSTSPNPPNEAEPPGSKALKSHGLASGDVPIHSSPPSTPPHKLRPRTLSETALQLAANIRKLSQDWSGEQSKIDNATGVTDQQRKSMSQTWTDKVMAQYDSKYKVDARIVHDKLVEALQPGTERLAMNDEYENEVNPGLLEIIASDLERLAKLLPAGNDGSAREAHTSISAPNGIAIGGGNVTNPTVNNYAPPQRQIPKQIENQLIVALKQYPGEVHLSSDSGDFEANTLARQFFSIFEAAGWHPIEIGTLMGGSALPQEIQIGYHGAAGIAGQMGSIPDDQPAARAVAQALFRSGFRRVTIMPNPNDKANVLSINIGHNAEILTPQ